MKVLFLTPTPVEGACTRYRAYQYFPYLKSQGVECIFRPFMSENLYKMMYTNGHNVNKLLRLAWSLLARTRELVTAERCDVVFIQREAMIIGPPVIEWIIGEFMRKPVVFDIDDATFVPYVSPTFGKALIKLRWFSKTDFILKYSSYVIAGNEYLKDYTLKFNKNVSVIPTVADTDRFVPSSAKQNVKKPVVGWIGSHSSTRYLKTIVPVLQPLAKKYDFSVKFVGANEKFSIPGVEVMNQEWRLDREIEDFQSLDIGLYPIVEDEWSVGKNGFKAIQYMSVGIPVVCSPVGVIREIVEDGKTGFLAHDPKEWEEKLALLINNPDLRRKFGEAGRAVVEERYSLKKWAPMYFSIIKSIMY